MTPREKLLFVCNQGENRSRTASHMFSSYYDVKHAGIFNKSRPLTREMLEWADMIFVFEERHIAELKKRFPGIVASKKVINLEIPDHFPYGDTYLKELIKEKVGEWIGEPV
jgi:predicted protein tyrosine phosphatase